MFECFLLDFNKLAVAYNIDIWYNDFIGNWHGIFAGVGSGDIISSSWFSVAIIESSVICLVFVGVHFIRKAG